MEGGQKKGGSLGLVAPKQPPGPHCDTPMAPQLLCPCSQLRAAKRTHCKQHRGRLQHRLRGDYHFPRMNVAKRP